MINILLKRSLKCAKEGGTFVVALNKKRTK